MRIMIKNGFIRNNLSSKDFEQKKSLFYRSLVYSKENLNLFGKKEKNKRYKAWNNTHPNIITSTIAITQVVDKFQKERKTSLTSWINQNL